MNVTLAINGRDFAPRLSTYKAYKEVSQSRVITTLSGKEISATRERQIVEFSVFPLDYETAVDDYSVLSAATLNVTYTDPDDGADETQEFRLDSNLDAVYGIKSINGNDYYKRGTIRLRAVNPEG